MRSFTITTNVSAKRNVWKDRITLERPDLEAVFASMREDGQKDGPCFVPGTLVGTERKAAAVATIEWLVYDIDGRQTFDQLKEIVDNSGLYAFIYSSFNHLSNKTQIVVDHYIRWAKKNGLPERDPSEEDVLAYVADKANRKDHLTNASWDGKIAQVENGQVFVITHDPLPKMRVLFPLKEPIVIADLAMGTKSAVNEFKAIYHGVGRTLGIDYDTACEDPSRLYYFPARKPGADYIIWQFQADKDDPVMMDWSVYPRAAVKDKTKKTKLDGSVRASEPGDHTVIDKNGVPINLEVWLNKNYDFDIEGLLQSTLDDDMLKAERSRGGFHITCPFEHEHTSAGGMGTFCANGDGDYSWTIHCMHDACVSQERQKLDYIAQWIKDGFITAADLGVAAPTPTPLPTPVAAVEPMSELEIAARKLGLDPSTLGRKDNEETANGLVNYDDKPLEGDDALTKEEVYDQCLSELRYAKTSHDISQAIGRIRYKQCDVDAETMVEMLAKSEVSGWTCVKHIRSFLSQTDIDIPMMLTQFSAFRERDRDINEWLKQIYDSAHAGTELDLDFKRMSAYYAHPIKYIKERHEAYQEALLGETLNNNIVRYFPGLRERYAKIKQGNSLVFIDMKKTLERADPDLYSKAALSTLLENRNVVQTRKNKEYRTYVFDRWCVDDKHIKEFEGITYLPRGAAEKPKAGQFNIWNEEKNHGFAIPPIEGDCSMITNHIKKVWCENNVEIYNWVITWLAQLVQLPGQKPHSALALLGPPGTGKSIIFEYGFSRILGAMYGASASREDVAGRWSGHLVGKLMWLSEETLFAGDVKSMQVLKDRISRKEIDVEKKGVDKFALPSYTRYIFTSNETHALHLSPDDRRFCVLQTGTQHQQDAVYFTKMRQYLEDEGANHFLYFLLNWKPEEHGLTWVDLNRPPYTDAKGNQITQSYQDMDNFFRELLISGQLTDTPRDVFKNGTISWGLEETYAITGERLRDCFSDYIRYHSGSNYRFERGKFHTCFERFIGERTNHFEKVAKVNGKSMRLLELPPRKQIIKSAYKRKMITKEDYDRAMINPTSHQMPENEVL